MLSPPTLSHLLDLSPTEVSRGHHLKRPYHSDCLSRLIRNFWRSLIPPKASPNISSKSLCWRLSLLFLVLSWRCGEKSSRITSVFMTSICSFQDTSWFPDESFFSQLVLCVSFLHFLTSHIPNFINFTIPSWALILILSSSVCLVYTFPLIGPYSNQRHQRCLIEQNNYLPCFS